MSARGYAASITELSGWVRRAIAELLVDIPKTSERTNAAPQARALAIGEAAAVKAAVVSGGLSLAPGPIGWLTIPVELAGVWRIQAQMVADIGGAYGRTAFLSRALLVRFLFPHGVADAAGDVAVRHGQRRLVERLSGRLAESIARRISLMVGKRGFARVVPAIGAAAAAYGARFDTRQVARAAIAWFERHAKGTCDQVRQLDGSGCLCIGVGSADTGGTHDGQGTPKRRPGAHQEHLSDRTE